MPTNSAANDLRRRKRRPKPGDTQAMRRILWQAALELENLITSDDNEEKLKTASTLATLGGVYLKAVEQADLEKQIQQLKAKVDALSKTGSSQARDGAQEPEHLQN